MVWSKSRPMGATAEEINVRIHVDHDSASVRQGGASRLICVRPRLHSMRPTESGVIAGGLRVRWPRQSGGDTRHHGLQRCRSACTYREQQPGAQQASGFSARMKALTNLPLTSFATASPSKPSAEPCAGAHTIQGDIGRFAARIERNVPQAAKVAPIIVADVFKLLRKLADDGTTVLMVEQNVRSGLKISDRAIALDMGRMAIDRPAAELLHDPDLNRLFLGGGAHAKARAA
jgi:hypothetical protein